MSAVLKPRLVSFGMRGTQKYRNKPTEVDGVKFPSKKEARRWLDLRLLEKSLGIKDLRRQVPYKLEVNGQFVCHYKADFVYLERDGVVWSEVVEDVKGYKTPEYRLKKRLMKVCLGITLRET